MAQVQKAGSRRAMLLILLALPSFIYFLVTYVLPPPLPILPEANLLDPSWQVFLTDAFLRGAQFGRDILYTFGPWGFVESPRGDPRIYPWLFGARLLIALAFLLGTSLIAARRIRRPGAQFLFLGGIALLSDPVSVLPMVLFAAVVSSHRERDRTVIAIVHLLAVACALTMWIKFTGFVVVGALAAALAALDLVRRRLPLISLEIAAASLTFWLLARQSLAVLPLYLHGAFSMARSYGAEMFINAGSYGALAIAVVVMLAVAVPAAILSGYRRLWHLWPALSWVALLFFLQLKEAFVRYDSFHVRLGIINALVPCVLILMCRAGFFDSETSQPLVINVLLRVCAGWVVLLSVVLTAMEVRTPAGFEGAQILSHNIDAVKALLTGRSMSADYRRQLEVFRKSKPLEEAAGTADFFPDDQIMLYGNSRQVRLPPVPQAFAAYNSYLSGLNASFFRGARRPDYVFFDIAPIDNRYPSAADPLSWLALMDCYRPSGNSGRYLVLRAANCEGESLDLVKEAKIRAGQPITIPAREGSPVWAEMDIRQNSAGSIVAALARPPLTELEVGTGMGRKIFRISPEMARTGFLLSPLVLDPASFGRVITQSIDPETEVRDLTIIQSSIARRQYETTIGVRLYEVHRRK
jgi:hypothetical protein